MQTRPSDIGEDKELDLARVAIHTMAGLRKAVRGQGSGWDLGVIPPTQLDASEQPVFAPPTRDVVRHLHTGLLKLMES